jgi:hypothetical protein
MPDGGFYGETGPLEMMRKLQARRTGQFEDPLAQRPTIKQALGESLEALDPLIDAPVSWMQRGGAGIQEKARAAVEAASEPAPEELEEIPAEELPPPEEADTTQIPEEREPRGALPEVTQEGDLARANARREIERLEGFRMMAEGLGQMGQIPVAGDIMLGRELPRFKAEGLRRRIKRLSEQEDLRFRAALKGAVVGPAGTKALKEERTRILSDTRIRNLKKFKDAAATVMQLVRSGNPLAAKGSAVKMARAMGDVGALSREDVNRWTRRPGAAGTLDQLLEFIKSEPTPEFLDQLFRTAQDVHGSNSTSLDEEREATLESFRALNPGVDTSPLEQLFGKTQRASAVKAKTRLVASGAGPGEFGARNAAGKVAYFDDTPEERARLKKNHPDWTIE